MYAKYSLVQYEASANHPSMCIPVSERWIASGKFSQLDPENKPFLSGDDSRTQRLPGSNCELLLEGKTYS